MRIKIYPPKMLRLEAKLPASKSISNRALVVQALSARCGEGQKAEVSNLSDCDDTYVMQRALNGMPEVIDIMAAGTAMRFLTAYLSITSGTHVITGTERMRHRPIAILVDALRTLGAQVEYVEEDGFPPLRVTGKSLAGATLELPGNVSSQYISALLMVGPMMEQGLTLRLTGETVSRPYIDMTLGIMSRFGAKACWLDSHSLRVESGGYKAVSYQVENDWSASSYWYEMMALTEDMEPEVILKGLFQDSLQGDSVIRDIFYSLGIDTEFFVTDEGEEAVRLIRTRKPVSHFEYDFVRQPDLTQTVVVTCVMLGVTFRFTGLQSLRIKETDRLLALRTELRKLGYVLHETEGSILSWDGERCQPQESPVMDTYEDHRMAMSLAPVCMKVGSLEMNNPQVVSKSYPHFWQELKGFRIIEEDDEGRLS